jgi:peroxiredoxin
MDTIAVKEAEGSEWARLSIKVFALLTVLSVFTIFITWRARILERTLEHDSDQPALVNMYAPDFSAATLDGHTVSLADFRGQKRVVVSFWASWCAPCRMEMPVLTKFYKSNHTASSDFEILAVSIDEDRNDASDFAAAQKLTFPVLLDSRRKVADAFEVDGIPTMFVIDKDGKIIYGHAGYDMAVEYELMRELGIKQKKPAEGGVDGGAGH